MDVLLRKFIWQFTLLYLDDMKIFSRTSDKYNDHFRQVSTLLEDADVTLNWKKCDFIAIFH